MKLPDEAICELIEKEIGEECVPLVELIKYRKNVSEFKIADKLKITVNQVRNILYRLQEKGLVNFTRKKDKKKGWYIYYWGFNDKNAGHLILNLKKKKLNELRERLGKEKDSYFFVCNSGCIRYRFEEALEHQFKCPECGQILVQEDNIKKMEQVKREIMHLESELAEAEAAKAKLIKEPAAKKKIKKRIRKKIKKLKAKKKRKLLRKKIIRKLKKKAKRKR